MKVEVLSSLDDTREIDLYEAGCENISTEQIEIQVDKLPQNRTVQTRRFIHLSS